MKKKSDKSAAVLSLFSVPAMTAKGRANIAAWLRRQATMMLREGKNYTEGRFTARYITSVSK